MKEKNYVASVRQDSNDNCDATFDVQSLIGQLQKLYLQIESLIDEQLDDQDRSQWCYTCGAIYDATQSISKFFNLKFLSPDGGCEYTFDEIKKNHQFMLFKPMLNSDKNHERSVATESDSSTEADKPLPNSPVKEDKELTTEELKDKIKKRWASLPENEKEEIRKVLKTG